MKRRIALRRIPFHRIRCRGREWKLRAEHDSGGPDWFYIDPAARSEDVARFGTLVPDWNATPRIPEAEEACKPHFARDRPAWLPIAYLCCLVDPADGPNFAAGIMDADPDDDAPALIACDWLEERAAIGRIQRQDVSVVRWADDTIRHLAPRWREVERFGNDAKFSYVVSGPIAAWCRHLIDTRCLACGGLKDGDDRIGAWYMPKSRNPLFGRIRSIVGAGDGRKWVMLRRRQVADECPDYHDFHPGPCPRCGWPRHDNAPAISIPMLHAER